MCGIVGTLNLTSPEEISEANLRRMLALIRHRGPDQFGIYLDDQVGLGSARLSILDLKTGQQPITNEDESLWIVFNGEIYNYVELRENLEAKGHQFTTNTDTEVILHLYEELGDDCLQQLNGQFVFAIWNSADRTLFLARDRFGIRPLFYTTAGGALIFGSEIKALIADPRVFPEIDPLTVGQIFTFWCPLPSHTVFKGIFDLPPGHFMKVRGHEITIRPYWEMSYPEADRYSPSRLRSNTRQEEQLLQEQFRELLVNATRIRLRADVPVGAYLSGGLDSSTIAAIIRQVHSNRLDTFSIAFSEAEFDERAFQLKMARYLGTDHHIVDVSPKDIGEVFPEVIWHTETPVLRTSPAPLFLLSKLVQQHQTKVVLTGEGADEFLAGYNIFKELKIRRFWAKDPESEIRPLLLRRLYPYIESLASQNDPLLRSFFRYKLTETDRLDYSHLIRWHNTSRIKRFLSPATKEAVSKNQAPGYTPIQYPPEMSSWDPLHRAAYLEINLFMSQYLLSSQGDRMAMAHSVEGRFPFLDPQVTEFCNHLPPHLKLANLSEKFLLKAVAAEWLPSEIWQRPKRPYRAPIQKCFFQAKGAPEYPEELLSPSQINQSGIFASEAVGLLVDKVKKTDRLSETEGMALTGILSTQLIHEQFISSFHVPPPLSAEDDIKRCLGKRRLERSGDGF